ncbi:MAG: outer membrane lipoprotein chaperone LolA [Gammaproteobacteria bacterium]|nr:outer membrane lipoprotein chaperone LolA [Gammaproteobacteria bacterium]
MKKTIHKNAIHKNMLNHLLVAIIICAFTSSVSAGVATQRLEKFFSNMTSLQANFIQTVLDENSVELQKSSGKVSIQRPDQFVWDYHLPYPQQIISDGKKLWIYDPDLEQVTVKPLADALAKTPMALLSQSKSVSEQFIVHELGAVGGGGDLLWVELEPKQTDTEYTRLYLGLDRYTLKQMELRDQFGQKTRIAFEDMRINPKLEHSHFQFKAIPGIDVIEVGG